MEEVTETHKKQIVINTQARGYWEGWTLEQVLSRNVCKAGEELGECAETVLGGRGPWRPMWAGQMVSTGKWCRSDFDDRDAWTWTAVDIEKAKTELADVLVTLRNAEAAINELSGPYDLDEWALRKSEGDIDRGVR